MLDFRVFTPNPTIGFYSTHWVQGTEVIVFMRGRNLESALVAQVRGTAVPTEKFTRAARAEEDMARMKRLTGNVSEATKYAKAPLVAPFIKWNMSSRSCRSY